MKDLMKSISAYNNYTGNDIKSQMDEQCK